MDNPGNAFSSVGKRPRRFWARLLVVRGLISRLANLFSATQQDLTDAGIYIRPMPD